MCKFFKSIIENLKRVKLSMKLAYNSPKTKQYHIASSRFETPAFEVLVVLVEINSLMNDTLTHRE